MSAIGDFFYYIFNQLLSVGINDIIDIAIVSVLLYYTFHFIRDRRAGKLAIGVVIFLSALALSSLFKLHVVNFLLQNIVQVGLLAIFIIFQPEFRTLLEKVGNEPIKSFKIVNQRDNEETAKMIDELSAVAQELSNEKTGALIVIERNTKLGDEIKTGVVVDATISTFLIKNIFFNKAPLHDGAMIIRDNKILACGCFLPLSSNADIIKDLGTRHRAAIGMSENSDAIILVISEENGVISIARDGKLIRNFDKYSLKDELSRLLLDNSQPAKSVVKSILKRNDKNRSSD